MTKDELKILAEALPQLEGLEQLDLSGQDIGDEEIKFLSKSLSQSKKLYTVN